MTTLSQITLMVARLITDVLDGVATAGTSTSLTDTTFLKQANQFWDRGTIWMRTGDHAGKFFPAKSFALNKLTFADLTTPIGVGDRFSVSRHWYPTEVIINNGIMAALDETFVIKPSSTLTGDGTTLEFTLPAGVKDLTDVELQDPNLASHNYPSTRWRERDGKLVFFEGSAPYDGYIIKPYYKAPHDALVNHGDEIDPAISTNWLKWKAAEFLLYWGVGTLGDGKEYRIEERLNRVLTQLKGLFPRKPLVIVKTAGGGR